MQQYEDLRARRVGGMALATHPIGKDARWAVSAGVDHDDARVQNIGTNKTSGDVTLGELAADLQYEHDAMRLDAAVGLALPFGVGADPWGEGKLVGKWKPSFGPFELTATVARKGRVPSLRERFDLNNGNPALGPEMIDHAEVRGTFQNDLVKLEAAPFYKRTTGTVRASVDPADMGMLINLGKLDIYGIDTQARVQVMRRVAVGASYNFIKAHSDDSGDDPLDRLPHNRADALVEVQPVPYMQLVARVKYYGNAVDKGMPVESYTLVEGSLSSRIYDDYTAVLRVDDALDVRPETRAGYHSAGRVVSLVLQGEWQ
jgi:outer membrane receptor protein involved in Fe transport